MNASKIVALLPTVVAPLALAQPFPAKPIRFIVPYTAGGGVDAVARILGQRLAEAWSQQVIVENRGGAQGSIGNAVVAKATPDGYTILVGEGGALCINPHLYPNVGFNTQRDFAPITQAIQQPSILFVHPSVPAKSIRELISLAKTKPGRLTFGTSSASPQIAGQMFQIIAKIKMTHVPYKGSSMALIDIVGGQIDVMMSGPSGPLPFIRNVV